VSSVSASRTWGQALFWRLLTDILQKLTGFVVHSNHQRRAPEFGTPQDDSNPFIAAQARSWRFLVRMDQLHLDCASGPPSLLIDSVVLGNRPPATMRSGVKCRTPWSHCPTWQIKSRRGEILTQFRYRPRPACIYDFTESPGTTKRACLSSLRARPASISAADLVSAFTTLTIGLPPNSARDRVATFDRRVL